VISVDAPVAVVIVVVVGLDEAVLEHMGQPPG
jgi:hypothetical protein